MAKLTPVDHDPFAEAQGSSNVTPVDYDPFAEGDIQGNAGGAGEAVVGGFNSVFPFGRKITSAIGAGIAKAGGVDQPYGELYDQAEADALATAEANPKSNFAGAALGIVNTVPLAITKTLIGTLPTSGIRGTINAIPKALGAASDWASANTFANTGRLAKAGNLVVQTAKSAALGAPGGAIYGASDSKTGNEVEGAITGAGAGAGLGAALRPVSAAVGATAKGISNTAKGAFARSGDQLEEAGQKIKDTSSKAYQKMRESGASFRPEAKENIINSIDDALKSDGPLNQGLHGNTMSVLQDLKSAAESPDFSLEELDQYRRLLSRIPKTVPEDVRKSSIVIDALDSSVNSLKDADLSNGSREAIDALNEGRKEYSKYSKFDRIRTIIDNSGGDANKLKSGLQRFANNPKMTRGFSPSEMKALQDAAKNTTGEGLLKMAGKFGIDLGSSLSVGNAGLPALYGAVTGATAGVGPAFGVVAGGTAARQAQKYIARAKADDLLKLIEKGNSISVQDIGKLSPSEAVKFLNATKGITIPSTITLKDKV